LASYGKNCVGMGSFKPGHGDIIQNNRCAVRLDTVSSKEAALESATGRLTDPTKRRVSSDYPDEIGGIDQCKNIVAVLRNNSYYTPHGNASYLCYDIGPQVSLVDMQEKYGTELSSTVEKLPPVFTLIQWAREMLIFQTIESDS
jgi:hypothetical protein